MTLSRAPQSAGGAHTLVACVPYECAQRLKRRPDVHARTCVAFGPGLCVAGGGDGSMFALQAATDRARREASGTHPPPEPISSGSGALYAGEWHSFTVLLRTAAGKDVGVGGDTVTVTVDAIPSRRSRSTNSLRSGDDSALPQEAAASVDPVAVRVSDELDGRYVVRCVQAGW